MVIALGPAEQQAQALSLLAAICPNPNRAAIEPDPETPFVLCAAQITKRAVGS